MRYFHLKIGKSVELGAILILWMFIFCYLKVLLCLQKVFNSDTV